jgi:DNA-directed RNA polymerase subunit RPC12/RpoP
MENTVPTFVVAEEGGIATIVDLDSNVITLMDIDPVLICPNCGNRVFMNGKCKTCFSCGWSSCDI